MKSIIIKYLFISVFLFIISSIESRTSDCLKVKLPHGGVLIGRHLVSEEGKGIRAFLGIPYAEPPIGELRFKPPAPFAPWQGEKRVITDSAICIQRDSFRRDIEISGSEDCLYLNVYTPHRSESINNLPVMVFFHGGGWQCGSGISPFYGPDYLLDHDIIYVAVNFRLGPLGFLSTGQEDCPGNNGLKDQVLSLKWIQESIKAFGGDPKQVTVFGESAGGASGTYHMMSPLAKGLFQKVISQSGTNLNPWAQPAHKEVAEKRAEQLASMLNCKKSDDNWSKVLDCLRKVPASDIAASYYNFFEWDTDPMIPFPPVVEPNLPGAFITKHPRDEINPHSVGIPWMVGITSDEGALKSAAFFNKPELAKDLNDNWKRALPIALYYNHHPESIQRDITKAIDDFYFKNRQLTDETRQNFTNLFTDGWFLNGVVEYLKNRLEKSDQKKVGSTFVYLFAHQSSASFTEIFQGGSENYYGVCHADELQHLFPTGKNLFVSAVPSETDIQIRKTLTQMWVNFARTGNPTPSGSEIPAWRMAKSFPLDYLRIGNKDNEGKPLIAMEKGLMEERSEFWSKLGAHLPAKVTTKIEL